MGAIKRTKEDAVFSHLVRYRAGWICEYCGLDCNHNHQALHCSHFQGRRHTSTRWHPLNAFAHCMGCHRKLGEQPGEFTRWVENQIGQAAVDFIITKSKTPAKLKPWEKKELYEHMKAQEKTQQPGDDFTVPDWYGQTFEKAA